MAAKGSPKPGMHQFNYMWLVWLHDDGYTKEGNIKFKSQRTWQKHGGAHAHDGSAADQQRPTDSSLLLVIHVVAGPPLVPLALLDLVLLLPLAFLAGLDLPL